ncbi:hypothetical protein Tco_0340680 [Tanacetum coccineum]
MGLTFFVARNGHFLEDDFLYKEINRDVDLLKPVDEEQTKEVVEEVSQQQIVQARERAIAAVDETQSIHISQRAHFQPERYYGFVIGRVDLSKPVTYYEAVSENEVAHWQDAIKTEMQSMYDNQVWELVDLPLTGRSERSKWVFKKKINMDGNMQTYKARITMVISAYYNYEIWHMDVKTAFPNKSLTEDRIVKQSTIVDSTIEADYIATSDVDKEAVWFKNFLDRSWSYS